MDYLTAGTTSPAELAMVHSENANRTPVDEAGRFETMRLCKMALEALDLVHWSDQITSELVRRKIGKAQERQGLQ